MILDDIPEQLRQRLVKENARASDEVIQCLFLDAVINDENLRVKIIERFLMT